MHLAAASFYTQRLGVVIDRERTFAAHIHCDSFVPFVIRWTLKPPRPWLMHSYSYCMLRPAVNSQITLTELNYLTDNFSHLAGAILVLSRGGRDWTVDVGRHEWRIDLSGQNISADNQRRRPEDCRRPPAGIHGDICRSVLASVLLLFCCRLTWLHCDTDIVRWSCSSSATAPP